MNSVEIERKSMKDNLIWNACGNIIYLAGQWITTYMVTLMLGLNQAGILSLAMSICNIFYSISIYGVRTYQVSDLNNEFSDKTYVYSRFFSSLLGIVLCLVFVLINNYPLYTKLCILVYMLFKTTESFIDVYHGIIQKFYRMDIIGISFIIRGIIANIICVTIMYFTKNLLLGLSSLFIVSAVACIIYDRRATFRFPRSTKSSFAHVKKILVKCFPLMISTFVFTSFTSIPRYFIEMIYGEEQLGIYASIALPVVIVQVLATYIFSPYATLFSEQVNNNKLDEFKKIVMQIFASLLVLFITAYVAQELLGEFALNILYGEKVASHAYLLRALICCTTATALCWFLSTIIIVFRELKSLIILSIFSLLVCVSSSYYFVNNFGLDGASYVCLLAFTIQCIGFALIIYRRLK